MASLSYYRRRMYLRLNRLEERTAPAVVTSLVSRTDPGQYSDAGGSSFIDSDLSGTVATPPTAHTVSSDGRYVAFISAAGNIVPGQVDDNGTSDVFVYDRVTNTTELISRKAGTTATVGNGLSGQPSLSVDGRYVAFESQATDLVAGM